jgi:hypothetical protein
VIRAGPLQGFVHMLFSMGLFCVLLSMGLFCVLFSMGLFCVSLSMGLFCVLFSMGLLKNAECRIFSFLCGGCHTTDRDNGKGLRNGRVMKGEPHMGGIPKGE